jgi:hypothetical protein
MTAKVAVTVTPVNDAPIAVADAGYFSRLSAPIMISAASLLANDKDLDGDALRITQVGSATNGTVSLNAQRNVLFTLKAGVSGAASFSYTISDSKGGTATARVNLTINDDANYSMWDADDRPSIINDSDSSAVELGVRFTAQVDGTITTLRFYKGPENGGTHSARLWTADGQQFATVSFSAETVQGWQQANLSVPIKIVAGQTYVASYHAPNGQYSANENFFSQPLVSGPLTAVSGVYKYGGAGSFPDQTYNNANYWVDVVFYPARERWLGLSGLLSAAAKRISLLVTPPPGLMSAD